MALKKKDVTQYRSVIEKGSARGMKKADVVELLSRTVRRKSLEETTGSLLYTQDQWLETKGASAFMKKLWKDGRKGKVSHIVPATADDGQAALLVRKPKDFSLVDSLSEEREVANSCRKVTRAAADDLLTRKGPAFKKRMVKNFSDWFTQMGIDSDFG